MKITINLRQALFICVWIHSLLLTVSSQCLEDQKSLLLEMRRSLVFDHLFSTKLVRWNNKTDCCQWGGVECNSSNGRVIGLDLSFEGISSGIDDSSHLFRLQFLQKLDLSFNEFEGNIPSAIGNLSSLTSLALLDTGLGGEVPVEISRLVNLVDLELGSSNFTDLSPLYIRSPNLGELIQNMTNLRNLVLDGTVFSAEGNKWGEAISSSLPHLEVLSMGNCNLTGGFHPSLAKLQSLSVIRLDGNNLSSTVPEFIASFTNLTTLKLSFCELSGTFPQKILQIPTLAVLALAFNANLQGTLPNSIGNLKGLIQLDLFECNFQGVIPPSLGRLDQLEYLDLSFNNFSGSIPSFASAKNLTYLNLGYNSLSGPVPESTFAEESALQELDLSYNNFEGSIPKILFQLRGLTMVVLSSNRFNGTVNLHQILPALQNLQILSLSRNSLLIDRKGTISDPSFPLLTQLELASCNLTIVPEFIKNQPNLNTIDLSNNQIQGKIPKWIWKDGLSLLNLSINSFIELEKPLQLLPSRLSILDLHSNNLHGQLPALPSQTAITFLDFSNNSFTAPINPEFGNSLSSAQYISLARNKIYGSIPVSMCNATRLEILDLSYNDLNGTLPSCLISMSKTLGALNLRENSLHGVVPNKFGGICKLETFNINKNNLDGHIPASLANCNELKVLDLGNNRLKDTFPCHLRTLSNLQVLVLRSNQLNGSVVCPKSNSMWPLLQIIDLASNQFNGQVSTLFLGKRMMTEANETQLKPNSLQYFNSSSTLSYYHDEVAVTLKGFQIVLQKIITIFTSIDLSNNAFRGGLPGNLGNLNALKLLNLSHNSFSSNIPASIGNLSQLESLDLCYNAFSGSIPQQLGNLNFLGYLNLSFNNLSGQIPTATQLQTFNASSYEGNLQLYGPPLTKSSKSGNKPELESPTPTQKTYQKKLEWILSGAAVGFPIGITIFFGPLICFKRWREWYNYHADKLLMTILPNEESRKRKRRAKANKNQRRRN